MSSQEGIEITLEQMFAAVLKTTGKVAISRENLLRDYGNANIRVEEIDNDTVTFELGSGEDDNDSRTTSQDNS